jgi:acetyl esterase/lipase
LRDKSRRIATAAFIEPQAWLLHPAHEKAIRRKTAMKAVLILPLAALGLALAGIADARERERSPARAVQAMPAKQTLSYGSDPLQVLDFYKAQGANRPTPLVVFVHGGGWKRGSKDNAASRHAPAHFTGLGYAYASIDYRLVPSATVEQQAEDIALALRALLDRAGTLGIDRSRIVIMGHSAGAHLVALVGTDEQYLRRAGLSFADLDGVIPNDGAAYDVPRQIAAGGRFMNDTYVQAFGTDQVRQKALSPFHQAASPNAPAFLLIHVQREDGIEQNKALETALRRAGTKVERRDFAGKGLRGHMEINRRLGDPDYPATGVVDQWLKRAFGS